VTTFDLACGKGTVSIDVPEAHLAGVLEGRSMPRVALRHAFDEAWAQPIGMGDPAELLQPGERLTIVVNDHSRPTPTRDLLPLLWERIGGRVDADDVTVLVATGTHRASTDEELDAMLGELRHHFHVVVHDCDRDVVEVGRSTRGTPIVVHRAVVEADRVASIGRIGMHYYAGYSGGRKNILPGVAGRATIESNHAMMSDARSAACSYEGNPISEEMVEAAQMVGLDFIVDVILADDGSVAKVVVGEPEAAHAAGRAFWDDHAKVPFDAPYDVVIASAGGHPKDINLYQAYKAQFNAMRAVRDGGILFLIAACRDGIGHAIFADWMERSDSPGDVLGIYEQEGFALGGHKAVYLAQDLRRATIFLRSDLDDATIRRFFMEPASNAEAVLDAARSRFGSDFRVLVIPHACDAFPVRCGA
jgi:nickel-dependent lactate racemase